MASVAGLPRSLGLALPFRAGLQRPSVIEVARLPGTVAADRLAFRGRSHTEHDRLARALRRLHADSHEAEARFVGRSRADRCTRVLRVASH
jgi:hypothetical protein